MALTIDDRLRHAQNRFESLLDVLDQPACLLQLMRKLAARLTPVALQDICVHAVDAQLRHRVGVQACHPAILDFLHDYVAYDLTRLARTEPGALSRVVSPDQPPDPAQLLVPPF